MNTYHDNLRRTITDLLQQRSLHYDGVSSALAVTKICLQYADRAVITAKDTQGHLATELKVQMTLLQRTEAARQLCRNENQRAATAMQYMKQGMTDAAVCASNVQVAANSIVRVAGDVSSAWSIENVADLDGDIHKLMHEAKDLVEIVAFDAEQVSRLAMELSMQTAEVQATELADRSKETKGILTGLYNVVIQAKDVSARQVVQAETMVADALDKQMVSRDTCDAAATTERAAKDSYAFAVNSLNQDLRAVAIDGDIIRLSFMPITDAFSKASIVQGRYAFIVKQNRQEVFTLVEAEELLQSAANKQMIQIALTHGDALVITDIHYKAMPGKDGGVCKLQDTDGDEIVPGKVYVAFVLTVYNDDYKKKLNCFDNWLSVASAAFIIPAGETTMPHVGKGVEQNGIAIVKKTEIDALVLDARKMQYEVDKAQAKVDGLTERAASCRELLAAAETARFTRLNDKNLCDQFAHAVTMLLQSSGITLDEIKEAEQAAQQLAVQFKVTVDRLVYAAEMIDKLANLIVRKKAMNPLISNELVSIVTAAGKDANNSVALALVALSAVFATETSNRAARSEIAAENMLVKALSKMVLGEDDPSHQTVPLRKMFSGVYDTANANYRSAVQADDLATKELNEAITELNKLQVKLKSLQAGLGAANAAALAN